MKKFAFILAAMIALGLSFGVARAQDDDEGPMSNMRFVVVRDASGKPVKNAAVVLHPVKKDGKQSLGGLELKTDEEGKTWIDGIPYGTLRVQVLVPGFQTFGEDYEIKKPETQIVVRLKRPTGQYSVYSGVQERDKEKNYGVQEKDKNTSTNKDNTSKDGTSKDSTSKDKKSDPPTPQQAQPQPPQANPPDQKPQ